MRPIALPELASDLRPRASVVVAHPDDDHSATAYSRTHSWTESLDLNPVLERLPARVSSIDRESRLALHGFSVAFFRHRLYRLSIPEAGMANILNSFAAAQ